MKLNLQTKIYTLVLLVLSLNLVLSVSLSVKPLFAAEVTRDSAKFDEVISDSTPIVTAFPQSIYVVQIKTENSQFTADSLSWYQNLYYYFVTRSGLTDMPFGYIIDRSGVVYEGISTGDSSIPFIEGGEGAVIIGYLSNGSDIPYPVERALQETIEELSYNYGISDDNVFVADMAIQKKKDAISIVKLTSSTTKFAKLVEPLFSKFQYSSTPRISFEAFLDKTVFEYNAKAGENVAIEIEINNSGDTAWFTDKFDIYLETFSGKDSQFAVNGNWESFQKVRLVEAEENVVPKDEKISLKFEMQAPLLPGTYEEKFQLKVLNGEVITGSTFTVKFVSSKGDFNLLKIKDTETGKLNVRKDPYVSSDRVTDVPSGRMYMFTEVDAGWYKIEYSADKFGWVSGKYVDIIQTVE